MHLRDAARTTKLVINSVGLLLLAIFIFRGSIAIYSFLQNTNSKVNPISASFGQLVKDKITSLPYDTSKPPTFSIFTSSGDLPIQPDRLPVFELQQVQKSVGLEEEAQSFATSLGFSSSKIELSSLQWQYEDKQFDKRLTLDILSSDFKMTSNFERISPTVSKGSAPSAENAISNSDAFLNQFDDIENNIKDAVKTTRFLEFNRGKVSQTYDFSRAQLTEVNYFSNVLIPIEARSKVPNPAPKETYPILTPRAGTSTTQVYVTNSNINQYKIPYVNYFAQRTKGNYSNYPLKNVNTAYEELKSGLGSVSKLQFEKADSYDPFQANIIIKSVSLNNIYLAYINTLTPNQKYLMPYFVFEGSAEVSEAGLPKVSYQALVPAIKNGCFLGEKNDCLNKN